MPGFGQWDTGKTLKMRTLKEMSLKARSQAQVGNGNQEPI